MSPEKPMDAPAPGGDEAAEGEDSPQGVFGNLPQTRPGARSPRRDAAAKRARPGGSPRPTEDAARALAGSEAPQGPAQAEQGEPDGSRGGIEDVAWAGVAAAAEAATIGVRLATRALEAMRDAVDRR